MKYHQIILGCQMNTSDAERLAGLLESLGFSKTDNPKEANFLSVQACSVRQSAIDRIYGRVLKWQDIKKKRPKNNPLITLLSGCVLEVDKKKLGKKFDLVIDTHKLPKELPEELKKNWPQIKLGKEVEDFFSLTPSHSLGFQTSVPIQTGCDNFCTFCAVPYTKGREKYRPHQDILREVKGLIKDGYKEIFLLGQNVNTYYDPTLKDGTPGKISRKRWQNLTDFPRLLRMVNDVPGDFWIRFVSANPWDMSAETIKAVAECDKVCEHVHLALQSGSTKILKKMNRHHTQGHYLKLVKDIKKMIPGVAITTDVIVGFPGETKKDFQDTAEVMTEARFSQAYIAKYSPRMGTVAARLYADRITQKTKKARHKFLDGILKKIALEDNQKIIGQEMLVLVENYKSGVAWGKTRTFKLVRFKNDKNLKGRFVLVKAISVKDFLIEGEVVNS